MALPEVRLVGEFKSADQAGAPTL
eukprot:COSAG05_NODE_5061_length_1274_cov_1.695319_2_plen_23_part_01